jgi:putative ribosome biogenesis GTPase RsgA
MGQVNNKVVVFGASGAGKSTLLNYLSGTNKFSVGNSLESHTTCTQTETIFLQGCPVTFIDTVGFGDNSGFTAPVKSFMEIFN